MQFYFSEPVYRRKTDRWLLIVLIANLAFLIVNALNQAPVASLIERFDSITGVLEQSQRSRDERAHSL